MTISKLIESTLQLFTKLEKAVRDYVIDYIIDEIEIDGNKINLTKSNINTLEKLRDNKKTESVISEIREYIKNGVTETVKEEISIYDVGTELVESIFQNAGKTIDNKVSTDLIYAEVKRVAIGLMSKPDGITLKEMRLKLNDVIVEKQLVQKYWSRWTHDIYYQYGRISTDTVRKSLGLKYAIYEGGLIEDSRTFCEQKNDKVFHEDEINSWIDDEFEGKPIGYNPIVDLGGFNCRHRLRWISDELAEQLLKNQN